MPYKANPFLERRAERGTSDQEFVRLFSPKILEKLDATTFDGAVHIFRSPPGGGKTTLLRALTPPALWAFWNAGRANSSEAYEGLLERNILDRESGPQLLGVFLSCSSGYADLPPGATTASEGLFRALFDCRVILRSLRSLALLLGLESEDHLRDVHVDCGVLEKEFKSIPILENAKSLIAWAEGKERNVYSRLDTVTEVYDSSAASHPQFESVLWLQSAQFVFRGRAVAPIRLLMIDDMQALRRRQRSLLVQELSEMRPRIPVWLAERNVAIGDELIAQGTRQGRDVREYPLEQIWGAGRAQVQFATFGQNILDRRLEIQSLLPSVQFAQYLRTDLRNDEIRPCLARGIEKFQDDAKRYKTIIRYEDWLARAESLMADTSMEAIRDLYVTRILIARDFIKRQMSLDLIPLPTSELEQRDSSQVQGAAEIFMHHELGTPYYFGIDRLCTMATANPEELLNLGATLYEAIQAKTVVRSRELSLSPFEQERVLKVAAKRKRDFIPRSHNEGTRAQRLLDGIGSFCREKTYMPNAPYAPGVTGVRLSQSEMARLQKDSMRVPEHLALLRRVLSECVAENLLFTRPSSESGNRESGTVFYLNRTLCAYYELPLQTGGWQDVHAEDMVLWMERGSPPAQVRLMELG